MDAPPRGWYFSRVRRVDGTAGPRVVPFHRTKYGPELLVDAAWVRHMPTFLTEPTPHALSFLDILLVTRGRGVFRLDGVGHRVRPGVLLFTRPGELREWRVRGLDGACLFFTEDFVTETFSDPRFLDQFPFFAPGRRHAALQLGPAERRSFLQRFRAMEREIAALHEDSPHALRAVLYEVLIQLRRWYAARFPAAVVTGIHGAIERFRTLVERDFAKHRRVADFAAAVGLSPGHLNALCRGQLRRSAGSVIRARLALEAKRLLLYSDLTAAEVADRLGFADPAYFARFVRRELGRSPSALRAPGRVARRRPAG